MTIQNNEKPKCPEGLYWRGNTIWMSYQNAAGRQIRQSTKTNKIEDAKTVRAQAIADVSRGAEPKGITASITFEQAKKLIIEDYRDNKQDTATLEYRLKSLEKYFGPKRKMASIKRHTLQAYKTHRRKVVSEVTVNREFACCAVYFPSP